MPPEKCRWSKRVILEVGSLSKEWMKSEEGGQSNELWNLNLGSRSKERLKPDERELAVPAQARTLHTLVSRNTVLNFFQ